MDAKMYQHNRLELRVEDIQYIPFHRCPKCAAAPRTTESGAWLRPYQDWFGTILSGWQDHLGYVYFQCNCRHHSQFSTALRVARLGDAILPMHFDDGRLSRQFQVELASLNADRVRQAVAFLAKHADPAFTSGTDWLAHLLYSLAGGGISPAAARREIQGWIDRQIELILQQAEITLPQPEQIDLESSDRHALTARSYQLNNENYRKEMR
jgi:hypothetical protein